MALSPKAVRARLEFAPIFGDIGGFIDITADLFQDDITWTRGFAGVTVFDKLAQPGNMTFRLRNDTGKYSPGHVNHLSDFLPNAIVRLNLRAPGEEFLFSSDGEQVFSSDAEPIVVFLFSDRWVWRGRLQRIIPEPRASNIIPSVQCIATDYMAEFLDADAGSLDLEIGVTADVLIERVLQQLFRQPVNKVIDEGSEPYAFAFDDLGENPKAGEVVNNITLSEFGFTYLRGGGPGEILRFENRAARAVIPVSFSFAPTAMVNEPDTLEVPFDLAELVNDAEVLVVPRRIDETNQTVLVLLDQPIEVEPSSTEEIFIDYRDPANEAEFVGGQDMIQPAANTDWTANTALDGSGTDITANFNVTAVFFGSRALLQLENTGGVTGFVRGPGTESGLQARGRGIFRFRPLSVRSENTASQVFFGRRELPQPLTLAYQGNADVGTTIGDLVVLLFSGLTPSNAFFPKPQRVRIRSELTPVLTDQAIQRDIGDLIALQEDLTAIGDISVHIHAIEQSLSMRGLLTTRWLLLPSQQALFAGWLLEVVGRSELGETTFLGA